MARNKTPALVEIRLPKALAGVHILKLRLEGDLLNRGRLERIVPQPAREIPVNHGIIAEIPIDAGDQPGKIDITQQPGAPGRLWNRITLENTGTRVDFRKSSCPEENDMDTIIRATVVYWVLLIVLRMIGRRTASQLSPFEMLVLFLLGGMSIQAVVADDRSLVNAIAGIFAIAVNHVFVSWLKEVSIGFRKVVDGTPVVVLEDGQVRRDLLHGLRMIDEDLMAAARQKGARSLDEIKLAVVERDGTVSLFRNDQK